MGLSHSLVAVRHIMRALVRPGVFSWVIPCPGPGGPGGLCIRAPWWVAIVHPGGRASGRDLCALVAGGPGGLGGCGFGGPGAPWCKNFFCPFLRGVFFCVLMSYITTS